LVGHALRLARMKSFWVSNGGSQEKGEDKGLHFELLRKKMKLIKLN
jgi:hypothetical protein